MTSRFLKNEEKAKRLEIIKNIIQETQGNISHAARLLEMDASNLRRMMRTLKFPGYPGRVGKTENVSE